MIRLTTEQAQQIEESLESCFCYDQNDQRYLPSAAEEALATIRAARAQEQTELEPVAWMHKCGGVCSAYDKEHMFGLDYFNIPLYAAQQPVQDIMEAVDAAMAEMQNINPPLRRSECERLIRAANYAAPVQQAEQEPFDMDDHPPHRLCECRKCMEYFTPLPDCDAFAASGKPIAGQTNTQLMEGYRIGLAEMREKCAKVCEEVGQDKNYHGIVAAIRAIKFEGDTGFRPVSEMIAEHKQDPKKAAAIEKAKMRKAEQEPLMDYERINALREGEQNGAEDAYFFVRPENDTPSLRKMFCQGFERGFHKGLKYASHVRTKDLTDEEQLELARSSVGKSRHWLVAAVIAKFKEKNK